MTTKNPYTASSYTNKAGANRQSVLCSREAMAKLVAGDPEARAQLAEALAGADARAATRS
jgi:hypothetical protein